MIPLILAAAGVPARTPVVIRGAANRGSTSPWAICKRRLGAGGQAVDEWEWGQYGENWEASTGQLLAD